jgi:hypothetical protein
MARIADRNSKNYGPQLLRLEARICVLKAVFHRDQKKIEPLRPKDLSTLWKTDLKQKEKENTIGEELNNRARNRKSSCCILSFTFFSSCVIF